MKTEYYEHLTVLVEAISLLNSPSISQEDLQRAGHLFELFSMDFQRLCGVKHMSFNVHVSRHLALLVSYTSNLWVTACYGLEDLNGKLANLAHGTKHAGIQITSNLSLLTSLRSKVKELPQGPAKVYCESLLSKVKQYDLNERLSERMYSVGSYDSVSKFDDIITSLLLLLYNDKPSFETFLRLIQNRILYVASEYQRSSRVSSFVKLKSGSFSEILTFVKVHKSINQKEFYALVRDLAVEPYLVPHLKYLDVTYVAEPRLFPVTDLLKVCYRLSVETDHYISEPLNDLEME